MAAAGLTHSQLAAKLIVEGCLAHIAGNVQGRMPVEPIPLTELERADLGLAQGGHGFFYPLPPTGVFFDMHGAKATVLVPSGEAKGTVEAVEAAIKKAFPRVKQLSDVASEREPNVHTRSLEVDFENGRLAVVEIDYAKRGPARFTARVIAQARRR